MVLETLKELMELHNVTYTAMANHIKVEPQSFRRIMRGETKMSIEVMEDVAEYLGYTPVLIKSTQLRKR